MVGAIGRAGAMGAWLALAAACSSPSTGTGGDAAANPIPPGEGGAMEAGQGSDGDARPISAAFVSMVLRPALDASNNNRCSVGSATTEFQLGTSASAAPTTVADGTMQGGDTIVLGCSVVQGFAVGVEALLTADGGEAAPVGRFSVNGTVDATGVGTNILATLAFGSAAYGSHDCTLSPSYLGGAVPTSPSIAPGRIWSHLSCPAFMSTSGATTTVSGMTVVETCDGEADFLFENCTQ